MRAGLEERQRTGKFSGELTFFRKNGERFPGEISTTLFQDSRGETHSSVIIRDLSEQKSVKERYTHLNRLLSTQSQVNRAIVRAGNRQSLFKEICDAAVERGNYRMAWIGLIDEREQLVKPVCFSGEERGYLDGLKISTLEDKNGMGPTGRAVREGVCVISQDISQDPCMVPWRERALSHGFLSSAAVPIRLNGVVTGGLTVYSSEVEGLDEQDRNQLEEIGESISFALDTFQKEAARREAQLAVQREKAPYQDMMSTQPAGVYRLRLERITDPASGQETSTTQIEMFSDRIFEITGLSRETFDNNLEHFYAIFEPEDLLRFKQASSATQFTLTPLSWEGRIRKQGEIRWIRIESIPRQIRPDEWIWTGMVYDITYRKQVEAQLEAQLEELQRWQKATLGREARILELKREVNDLLAQNSLPARYPAAELDI